LIPYFIIHNNINVALLWSTGVTLVILLLFGVAKTHFSGAAGGWKGYAWGAISTMLVGGLAGESRAPLSISSFATRSGFGFVELICSSFFVSTAGAAFGLVRLIESH